MKILVISSNLIGDTILSTGVIQFFLNKYPNSKFTFVIGPSASQIYHHFPNLENIIKIKKKKYDLHWLDIIRKCIFIKWDIIIDFRSSLISYILFNNKKFIFKKNNHFHHLEQLSKLFKFDCSKLTIYNSPDEIENVEKVIDRNIKYIVIFPGGNWIPKLWPAKNFNILIKKINNNYSNIKFIIVGSREEKKIYYDEVTKDIDKKKIIDLMGNSLTLTSAFMKQSSLFVGNDSGLMHLSVASNLKTIALFGPTNDLIYSPKGKKCFVIRTKESYEYFLKNIDDTKKSYMQSIEVDDVINIIKNYKLL